MVYIREQQMLVMELIIILLKYFINVQIVVNTFTKYTNGGMVTKLFQILNIAVTMIIIEEKVEGI